MDNHTEQVADGLWRIEVGYYTNVFLLARDGRSDADGLALVDTGWRRSGPRLVRSIRMLGLDPRAVEDVLLSHWHPDHAGSAARLARSSAAPAVHAAAGDLAVVRGADRRPARGLPSGAITALGRAYARLFGPPAPVPDAAPLAGGQTFELCGGLRVIDAPGHTPGHCAFHLPRRGVLLSADAVWNVWRLRSSPRLACSLLPAQSATLRRLAQEDFDVLAPAHGPPVDRGARRRLQALVP